MFNLDVGHISFLLVFAEGILSFFSPCVIPLLPLYISYLAGNAQILQADGSFTYKRKTILGYTVCFIVGILAAIFLLGLSFSAIGRFFGEHQTLFSRIGGLVIIILGLIQVGFLNFNWLNREHRLKLPVNAQKMTPLTALVMGFTFSFAWTPCVGPALSSVLIMASAAKTAFLAGLLISCYALGFVLPFLALGLFTAQVLNFLKSNNHLLGYTIKAGGIILLVMGLMVFTGWNNSLTGYLSDTKAPETEQQQKAIDFTLYDQYGNEHTLSDYQGKVVFLNFWATWCGPCRMEMPYIEELYQEYGENNGDVVFLAVARPNIGQEKDIAGISEFLTENGYHYPTVFDESGEFFARYGIRSFPTTFMIDKEGCLYGYVEGALSKEIMLDIIKQTQDYIQQN